MAAKISKQDGRWIQYQLQLNNYTHDVVAKEANCTISIVSHFLRGRKNSDKVKAALCKVLKYESFDALLAARQTQGYAS